MHKWFARRASCVFRAILLGALKPSYNNAYNSNLQPFANRLRKEMTKAEAALWKYVLRARGMKGYQFRRQRPILKYIADFMCRELKLVIEVDGYTHGFEETAVKDYRKDNEHAAIGIKVIRGTDDDVLKNIQGVAERIEKAIEEIEDSSPCTPASGGHTELEHYR